MQPVSHAERTMLALDFEATDRVPVVGGFLRHPEFLAEVAGVSPAAFWQSPRRVAVEAFRRLDADLIMGLILPNSTSEIAAEVEHKQQTQFTSPEDVKTYAEGLPPPGEVARGFDAAQAYASYLQTMQEGQALCGDMLWLANGVGRYCINFDLGGQFGYENYVMALTLYPESMGRLFANMSETAYQRNQAVARATREHGLTPVVWTGADSCDNRGPYVRPEIMREIYFPHLRRSLAPLREAGITIIWHADGNIAPIAHDLLAAGVDGFQGLQERVDVKVDINWLGGLTTLSGRRPIIAGSICTVTTLPYGTVDDVRNDVQRCIDLAKGRGGGWLINSSSSVGPEVPRRNLYALFHHATQRESVSS